MRNKLLVVFVQLLFIATAIFAADSRLEIRGHICVNENSGDTIPDIKILFNGMETLSNQEGFYSFPLDEEPKKFRLILSNYLKNSFRGPNTIEDFRISPDRSYKYFSLTNTRSPEGCILSIKEKTMDSKNFVVPKNTVVVMIDPKYVEKIEPWNAKLSENCIRLPKIFLKSEMKNNKKLQRAAAKSILNSLDIRPFHANVKEQKKIDKSAQEKIVKISLAG
jgi:hypothetical protein